MKVLLVNPPWVVGGRKGVRAGSRWPHLKIPEEEGYMPYPFFLGYASSLLKVNNFEVKVIDAIAEDISDDIFRKRIIDYSPDLLLSETSTPSIEQDINLLKELKKEIGCKLALAGPDINLFNKEFLKKYPSVDFVLIGEYEYILLELCHAIKNKTGFKGIKGLIFRIKKEVVENKRRELINDLNQLPWPDREELPIYKYHDCPGGIPEPSAQMWASRGCPYQCVFCAWPQIMYNGSNYRIRDVKDVVEEMEYLVKTKGFKSIYFDDDTFNIGKKRMLDLALEIRKRNLNIQWAFMGRADLSDRETLEALRSSGLAAVKYGMESGVQELVDKANKNLNLKKAIENIRLTKELGIKFHLTFTFGLPGETKQTIMQTINLALDLDPDSVQFSITTPFPGTKLYEDMKKQGNIISFDWQDYDGNTKSVIKTNTLDPEELKKAQEYAYKKWHEHKFLQQRYSKLSPINLFNACLKQHGLKYTLKKTIKYVTNKEYGFYLFKKNKILLK